MFLVLVKIYIDKNWNFTNLVDMKFYLVISICIPLITNEAEHLFMFMGCLCFLCEESVIVFCSFLCCLDDFVYFRVSSLSIICIANIFFQLRLIYLFLCDIWWTEVINFNVVKCINLFFGLCFYGSLQEILKDDTFHTCVCMCIHEGMLIIS